MHNPKHQHKTTMETKSVDQLKKELAEAEAREQGLMIAPYVAVKWNEGFGGGIAQALKLGKNGRFLCVYSHGSIIPDISFPDYTKHYQSLIPITAEQFNEAYEAAMLKIKEAKDE